MNEKSRLGVLNSSADNRKSRIRNPKWLGPSVIAFVFVVGGPVTEAQQPRKIAQIGRLTPGSASTDTSNIKAFREGLRNLGYIERQNITIEYRYGEGID
jgi:hypothetical protein